MYRASVGENTEMRDGKNNERNFHRSLHLSCHRICCCMVRSLVGVAVCELFVSC